MGTGRQRRPDLAHRHRFAQLGAFRRGPRRLHVRQSVRRVRHHLPLRHVAAAAPDEDVLAPWLASLLRAPLPRAKPRGARSKGRGRGGRQPLHLSSRRLGQPPARAAASGKANCPYAPCSLGASDLDESISPGHPASPSLKGDSASRSGRSNSPLSSASMSRIKDSTKPSMVFARRSSQMQPILRSEMSLWSCSR